MTGLFSDLSSRFQPGAQPAIRPRPQARFEADGESAGLEEETLETVADPLPVTAPDTRTSRPGDPPPSPTPASDNGNAEGTAPGPEPIRSDEARRRPGEDIVETTPSARHPVPEEPETERVRDRTGPVGQPPTAAPIPEPDLPHREIIAAPRDIVAPSPDKTPEALPTRPLAVLETFRARDGFPEQDAPGPDEAEPGNENPPPPTIRIGRIEVRQPAPAKAEPRPVTVRTQPAPARRSALAAARSGGTSRLTDYLGWKK